MPAFTSPAIAGALALAALLAGTDAASAGCFRACVAERISSTDSDLAMRNTMRDCRDSCAAGETASLKAEGIYDAYASCKAAPLSGEEFKRLRGENPSFIVQSNVLSWEFSNQLPDKVIRMVEIGTQTMNLSDAYFTTRVIVPPGRATTIVLMDFFDGYPTVRYASKITRIEACPVK